MMNLICNTDALNYKTYSSLYWIISDHENNHAGHFDITNKITNSL